MLEKFNDIVGQICIDVKRNDKHLHEDEIHFTLENGDRYALAHSQDCCESVVIESIEGDLKDLVGSPIVMADESSNTGSDEDLAKYESCILPSGYYQRICKYQIPWD